MSAPILNHLLTILQEKMPPRNWKKVSECQRVIKHSPEGGCYQAVAVNNKGLLAVTDSLNKCVHLLTKDGTLVRSIGRGVLGDSLLGVAFDLKGNVWVTDSVNNRVVKLSQNGQLVKNVQHAGSEDACFHNPTGVSVGYDGLIYICDCDNHRITVHDTEGNFLNAFGCKGKGPGCFDGPTDVAFGSDGLMYVTDVGNNRVCAWSKVGTLKQSFEPNCAVACIAATGDNHLLITSHNSNIVMVYTLEGQLIHLIGGYGFQPGRFSRCWGICIDTSGLVYVADCFNKRVQVF